MKEKPEITLPEEMFFTSEEIPQRKFVITDSELRLFFDAWMFSTKDVKELHKLNDIIRERIISVGHVSGLFCARCLKHKSSGYFLCEDCFHEINKMG
jgi:hypothetical protein